MRFHKYFVRNHFFLLLIRSFSYIILNIDRNLLFVAASIGLISFLFKIYSAGQYLTIDKFRLEERLICQEH